MKKLLLICLLYLLGTPVQALSPEDLLPPDQAFQFSARPINENTIKLEWKIADGYYLYRDKIVFESASDGLTLDAAAADIPAGDTKDDPTFGKLQVYHGAVAIEVPYERANSAQQAVELTLKSKYQGCADAGLCYPPQNKTVQIKLASLDTETSSDTPSDATPKILTSPAEKSDAAEPEPPLTTDTEKAPPRKPGTIKATSQDKKPLSVEQAFQFNLLALDRETLVAHWDIQPDHQLYRAKIKFSLNAAPENISLGEALFPQGTMVDDEYFGEMEVFSNSLDVSIPLQNNIPDQPLPATLMVETEYQGCSNKTGICYPPVTRQTELQLTGLPPKAAPLDNGSSTNAAIGEDYSSQIAAAGFSGTIVLFFGIGLLLAFTPCIFPMIPILSGVIAGQSDLSARKAFLLSLAYVTASASAYAIIGIVFGIFGANLQSALQHPAAIGTFAALFVALAFSMFGFFDLQLPNSLQTRLNELSNKQRSGSLIGAAIMGFLSTLIVGPCVAPPLAGALTYIAQTKDALLGGAALFTMGFAMGIPLLIVGTSAGHLLPRAGAWMDTTKAIFGIIMLGLAIWMLSRILPIEIIMALSGILLVSSGIHMGALDKINEEMAGWSRFWKSIGLIMLFYGALQLLGVATGSTNLLQPLKGVLANIGLSGALHEKAEMTFKRIKSIDDLEKALATAQQNQQHTMLDFYADWCTECKRMEKNVFAREEIIRATTDMVLLQADVTANDAQDIALLKHAGIIGPPTILFFDSNGEEIQNQRLIGYENATAFAERLQNLAKLANP